MTSEENNVEGKALLAIENGQVKMRPKWQFLVRSILLVISAILSLLAILFLASFILFVLRQSGLWFAPGFGLSGFGIFFRSLPWVLILLVIILVILLEYLVRKYSFGYGRSLFISMLAILLIALTGGIILEMTPLHRDLFVSAHNNQLPFGGIFYQHYGGQDQDQNLIAGNIAAVSSTIFIILTPRDEDVPVVVGPNTIFTNTTLSDLGIGDAVVIEVQRVADQIRAINIIKIVDEMHFPRGRRGPSTMMRLPMMLPSN